MTATPYINLQSFGTLREYILAGRDTQSRKIANNTIARIEGNQIDIYYHNKLIVEINPDYVILHDCGYKTFTTKERLNWFLPNRVYLYQQNFQWFIDSLDNTYVYQDGIIIYPDGTIKNAGIDNTKKHKKLITKINKYCDDYMQALIAGDIPKPSGGDCWYCYLVNSDGKTLPGSDHLLSHIEEKYYVPSLLVNAVKSFPMSKMANYTVGSLWYGENNIGDFGKDILLAQGKSSLKRFILRELNIA